MKAGFTEGLPSACTVFTCVGSICVVYDDKSYLVVAHELMRAGHALSCKASMWLAASHQDKEEAAAVAGYCPSVLLHQSLQHLDAFVAHLGQHEL